MKLLLEQGADPNIANDLMYTPLHEAAQYGHTEVQARVPRQARSVVLKAVTARVV